MRFLAIILAFGIFQLSGSSAPIVQSPGVSAALFASPYYTCVTNRYIATAANGGSDSNDGTSPTHVSGTVGPWLTLQHADSTTPTAGFCINVGNGTYATGMQVNHGGNLASSTGYVVYRCATLNGCTITDPGNQGNSFGANTAIFIGANYVMFDGFVLASSPAQGSLQTAFNTCNDCTAGTFAFGFHHIWLLNNQISGYGLSGVAGIDFDYYYVIHNKVFQNGFNAGCNGGSIRGSGISLNSPISVSGYTPTADDASNPVTGTTGTLFKLFVMWNDADTNHVASGACTPQTDGNGIILDTFNWNCSQGNTTCSPTGAQPYLGGTLVAFNIAYNNGGYGLHNFASQFVTFANNSCYNNFLDTSQAAANAPCMDDNGSYGNTYVNNASFVPCNGTGFILNQQAVGLDGIENGTTQNGFSTTLGAAITTTSQTSITLSSAANMPGGANAWSSNGWKGNGDFRLPGGNMVQIGSEVLLVTAGWGTTTLTVSRGFAGTAAATHTNGTTVQWIPTYWANNVVAAAAGCTNGDGSTIINNFSFWPSSINKAGTNPLWVNVGNTSTGNENTVPNGANFALQGTSQAIGFGATSVNGQTFLPSQSADVGACYHTLGTCP